MAANAVIFSKDKRILILKVRMSDKDVTGDSSGVGMEDQGSVQCYGVPKRCITDYYISEDVSVIIAWIAANYFSMNNCAKQPSKLHEWAKSNISEPQFGVIDEFPVQWEHVVLKQSKAKAA